MDTMTKNLTTLAAITAGLCLQYFAGSIILELLQQYQLVELINNDEVTRAAICLALGLPVLLAQIAVSKYAAQLAKELF